MSSGETIRPEAVAPADGAADPRGPERRRRPRSRLAGEFELPNEPDLGLQLATTILERRAELGGTFTTLAQLLAVKRVGRVRFTRIVRAILGDVEGLIRPEDVPEADAASPRLPERGRDGAGARRRDRAAERAGRRAAARRAPPRAARAARRRFTSARPAPHRPADRARSLHAHRARDPRHPRVSAATSSTTSPRRCRRSRTRSPSRRRGVVSPRSSRSATSASR